MYRKKLKKYIPLANMIGDMFGKNCEVVLHDLTSPTRSVIYVCNNSVTGRKIGDPFDHLIKDVLLSAEMEDDFRSNYLFIEETGKKIKSSTWLIRNNDNRVIGALCINFDITNFEIFSKELKDFIYIKPERNKNIPEDLDRMSNVKQVLNDLIEGILADINHETINRKKRLDLISFMDQKGVFMVKGAVEKVAEKMNISTVTVYSYLDEVRKKNGK